MLSIYNKEMFFMLSTHELSRILSIFDRKIEFWPTFVVLFHFFLVSRKKKWYGLIMYCIFGNIFIRVSKWFIESCLHSKHCPWKRINYKVIFRTFVQTSDRLIMCRYIVTKNLSYTAWYLHFFMYHVFWNCVKLDDLFLI